MFRYAPIRLMSCLAASVVLLAACQTQADPVQAQASAPARSATAHAGRALDGIWRSDGYGYAVELGEDTFRYFDVTPETCVEADTEGWGLSDVFDFYRMSADGRAMYLSSGVEPYEYVFRRTAVLPDVCEHPMPDTPAATLDTFIAYFRTHYAFFDLYGVDWEALAVESRAALPEDSSDEGLFTIMAGMLADIRDAHVELTAEVDGEEVSYDANPGAIREAVNALAAAEGVPEREKARDFYINYWSDEIGEQVLGGKGVVTAQNRIQYGLTSDDIGYVAFMTVGGYTEAAFEDSSGDAAALDAVMEEALALFEIAEAKAVIIDLSINFGGHDFISRRIAGRFTDVPVKAYSKYANDSSDHTPFQEVIAPSEGRRFTGPVYVLTSPATVSGGESLTMSLRPMPNVVHAGEATRGALSDTLVKALPNGWELSLSNEVYLDHEGKSWEAKGIPPEMPLAVFDPVNPFTGHVGAVKRLVEVIDRKGQQVR